MALKIGSVVRTKNFEYCRKNFQYMSELMKKYCGKTGTIVRIEQRRFDSSYADAYGYHISFNNKGSEWIWSIDCLDVRNSTLMETE